jgi:hypothetical protein
MSNVKYLKFSSYKETAVLAIIIIIIIGFLSPIVSCVDSCTNTHTGDGLHGLGLIPGKGMILCALERPHRFWG